MAETHAMAPASPSAYPALWFKNAYRICCRREEVTAD